MKKSLFAAVMAALAIWSPAMLAQQRSCTLSISVATVEGDNLVGQPVEITQTDYDVTYELMKLDASGQGTLKIYPGAHKLRLEREGFNTLEQTFSVAESETAKSISLTLTEATRTPFALTATPLHDAFTGKNSVQLGWNVTAPVFFDDFESYPAFAIEFGEWTGIDADQAVAAAIVGSYPNRGVKQYAQVINPLTVEPTWWYDMPVLRPYSGQQYIGFTRTYDGVPNDDWLISPEITPGEHNVVSFLAKAADKYQERFQVYVTEKTDNPAPEDFTRLDTGNYESVGYQQWQNMSYDLSDYAGKKIKIAIRYIGDANRYGAFMLMVDDFRVGQPAAGQQTCAKGMARRVAKSPDNKFESFEIYLDGTLAATVDEYNHTLEDVAPGKHTIGIRAKYLQAQSETATIDVDVASGTYHKALFSTKKSSLAPAAGTRLLLLNTESGESYELVLNDNEQVELLSLPDGKYGVELQGDSPFSLEAPAIDHNADATYQLTLSDVLSAPFNITHTLEENGDVTLRWNQNLMFTDSFEDYKDFATGSFGDWIGIDEDGQPVYPIALGDINNVVSFPGAGTGQNPLPLGPIVFNPWNTVPPMMPSDPAIAAATGYKSVMFCSAQRAKSSKWLISPEVDIHSGYAVKFKAKAYNAAYAEQIEVCVAEEGSDPDDFTVHSDLITVPAQQWSEVSMPLDEYEGKSVRIAVHYVTQDGFLLQVDDVTIGPADGQGEVVDYGNIRNFDVELDGKTAGNPDKPVITIPKPEDGEHSVKIRAHYFDNYSDWTEYKFNISGATVTVISDYISDTSEYYDMLGRRLPKAPENGIYIERRGAKGMLNVKFF